MESTTNDSTVAVIMPTYNSAEYLDRCLESLQRQTFTNFELWCVDRGSTDGTVEMLERWAARWPKLRVLRGGNERTSQFNMGVRASRSKYIYYPGSDFVFDPTLLEEAVSVAERDDADAVMTRSISTGNGYWARVHHFERQFYFGTEKFEGARFFTRDMYERAGGYDDKVPIFEEYDLQDRMKAAGARFARVQNASEYHLGEPTSAREIWRRAFYIGTKYRNLVGKQGARAYRHLNPVRAVFFKDPLRYVRQPNLAFGFLLFWFMKYAGAGAGVIASFLPGLRSRDWSSRRHR